jgi:hypothetical protein
MAGRQAWRALRNKFGKPARAVAAADRRHERPVTAYERSDWPLGPIAVLYSGIIALLVICCFVLVAAYPTALPDVDRARRIAPPGPRLQTDAGANLQRFRAEERKRLETYYWIDRQKGVVHVPIDQAMKKLAGTGIAGFPQARQ